MSGTALHIEIVTPRSTAYSAEAQAITMPGTLGPFQILINHAPIISSLEVGLIKIIDHEGLDVYFATNGGFAEVKNNKVSIVVESAELATDIEIESARAALAEAEQRLAGDTTISEKEEDKLLVAQARNRVHAAEMARMN